MEAGQYRASLTNNDDEGGLDFGPTLGALRRQIPLIAGITAVVTAAAVFKAVTDTPVYSASFELLTEPVTLETRVLSSTNPETLSNQRGVVEVQFDEVKLRVLKSPNVIAPVVEELQEQYPNLSYSSLVSNLQIKASEASKNENNHILEVGFRSNNPQQVRDVLQTVAEAYLDYSLEKRQTDITRGIDFLEDQLPQLRSRVDGLQGQLQNLRQRNNLIEPTSQAQQLSEQVATFVQQQLETRAQLNEAQLLAIDLERELSQESIESASASLLASPHFQELRTQLQVIDAEMAKQSVLFFEESPEMTILRQQRQKLVPLLRQEGERILRDMESHIRELKIRDISLTQTIDRLNQEVKQLSVTTRDYTDLQRELDIASDNLNQFIVKREALRIDVAQNEVPWELLSPPSQPQASSDSVKKNFAMGAMLGVLMGVGAALAVDKLSNILHTSKEVKDLAQLPVLGIIPFDKALEESTRGATIDVNSLVQPGQNLFDNLAQPDMSANVVEAFRSLYFNLRLLNPDQPLRSLVVSSSTFGEGKSTVAINLAKAASTMGRRVLLVDTDLRSSGGPNQAGMNRGPGLTDVISGSISDVSQVIQRVALEDGENNLFVLASGSIPPEPIRLLASEKMQDLMQGFTEAFDLVIYDAPVLVGFSDAHMLATSTSGVVLVAGLGKLKRTLLEQAMEQLRLSRTPVLGLVVNRSKDTLFDLYNVKKSGNVRTTEAAV